MKVHHILISFLLLAEPDHISGKLTRVRGGKSKDYANEKERNEDVNVDISDEFESKIPTARELFFWNFGRSSKSKKKSKSKGGRLSDVLDGDMGDLIGSGAGELVGGNAGSAVVVAGAVGTTVAAGLVLRGIRRRRRKTAHPSWVPLPETFSPSPASINSGPGTAFPTFSPSPE